MYTSDVLTASIWPNNKSSKFIVTFNNEIKTNPNAKKEEKIIPIAVSSPTFVFLIIMPSKIAIRIAAGTPNSDMLNPKNTPTAIMGSVACAIASAIKPIFLLIAKGPKIESIAPEATAVISDLIIKSYLKGSKMSSITTVVFLCCKMRFIHKQFGM